MKAGPEKIQEIQERQVSERKKSLTKFYGNDQLHEKIYTRLWYRKIVDSRNNKVKVKMYLDVYCAINFIRKVQHNKSSKGKVFSYLKKLNKDCSYDLFDINMDKVVKDNYIEGTGDDDQE